MMMHHAYDTTITLNEHPLAHLQTRASESGTSVSRLIERAVRLHLRTSAPSHGTAVTFAAAGRFPRATVDTTSALNVPLVAGETGPT